jgi:hypothetical protein
MGILINAKNAIKEMSGKIGLVMSNITEHMIELEGVAKVAITVESTEKDTRINTRLMALSAELLDRASYLGSHAKCAVVKQTSSPTMMITASPLMSDGCAKHIMFNGIKVMVRD